MVDKLYLLFLLICCATLSAQKENLRLDAFDIQSLEAQIKQNAPLSLEGILSAEEGIVARENDLIDKDFPLWSQGFKSYNLIQDKQLKGKLLIANGKVYLTRSMHSEIVSIYPNQSGYTKERGIQAHEGLKCMTEVVGASFEERSDIGYYTYGDDLQSFRLAIITTGEFYQLHGGNDTEVMADIVSTLNSINFLFEREFSVNFTLSGRIHMFTDSETDPFTPNLNPGAPARTNQSSSAFIDQFEDASYDLGITFNALSDGWSGGGLAVIRAACSLNTGIAGPSKAKIWAASNGVADNSFTAIVAHELGHAFGARHTMNSDTEICADAISDGNSFEIGSGNTLMSYVGRCGDGQDYAEADETINNYFHFHSLYTMSEYIQTLTCQNVFETNNTPPELNINPCGLESFKVPLGTPFRLDAEASDAEGNDLTYCWEQYDEDGPGTPNAGFIGADAASSNRGPLFRGFPPSSNSDRLFPRFFNFFLPDPFETLSTVERDITMRCTVRDNSSEGGIFASDELTVEVLNVGPFRVEIDSLLDTIVGGETINITWSDNGVSDLCGQVDVELISLADPDLIIPIAENVPFSDLGVQYFVAPGFSINGNFHIKIECHVEDCFSFYNFSRPVFSQNNCPAPETFYVCGIDDVTANLGDPTLVFETSLFSGIEEHEETFTIEQVGERLPFIWYNLEGSCEEFILSSGNPLLRHFKQIEFQVSESGTYTFRNETANNFASLYVFEKSSFDPANLCASLVGTSVDESPNNPGTNALFSREIDIELNSCTEYLLAMTNLDYSLQHTISIKGSSLVTLQGSGETSGDFYFVLENQEGTIEGIFPESDFTSMRQGDFHVYVIKVDAELFNPEDFIGKKLFDFGLEGVCIDRSTNTSDLLLINTLPDEDGDGYHTDEDCNDNDENVNPGQIEIANNDIDENCDGELLIIDEDGDGFNSAEDCDDMNPDINPEQIEIPNNDIDEDCDGEAQIVDEDGDGFNSDEDCDDTNPAINPDAEEIENNPVDENCDGIVANFDADGDGFNSEEDCDDSNPDINPNAEEVANNDVDENCDGELLFIDEDGDGFTSDVDCDDMNPDINPDAEEILNNDIDEDCDGEAQTNDADMDGFTSDEDCDDMNPDINPDAEEIPNNDIDEDCDGEAQIIDEDGDGFNSDEDCDDTNPDINPDAPEVPNNNIDENCNGEIAITDVDQDGFNSDEDCDDMNPDINPDAEDIPNNGIDEDCDGMDLVSSVTNISQINAEIYPNPFHNQVKIILESSRYEVSIFDALGNSILKVEASSDLQLNTSEWLSGIYLIHIRSLNEEKESTFKVVKM